MKLTGALPQKIHTRRSVLEPDQAEGSIWLAHSKPPPKSSLTQNSPASLRQLPHPHHTLAPAKAPIHRAIVKMAKADTKTKSSTSTQKRTTKAKKDPDAPKRPLSAYMFFSQDQRERVKNANPEAGFGEVGRLLGAKWKEMSEAEKKPYNDMANRDKARAEAEKAAYNKRR